MMHKAVPVCVHMFIAVVVKKKMSPCFGLECGFSVFEAAGFACWLVSINVVQENTLASFV